MRRFISSTFSLSYGGVGRETGGDTENERAETSKWNQKSELDEQVLKPDRGEVDRRTHSYEVKVEYRIVESEW